MVSTRIHNKDATVEDSISTMQYVLQKLDFKSHQSILNAYEKPQGSK